MVRVTGEMLIGRAPAEVFDFVADERNEPLYNGDDVGDAVDARSAGCGHQVPSGDGIEVGPGHDADRVHAI